MRRLLSLILLLCLSAPAVGQGVLLPSTVTGDPGAWTVIVPTAVDGGAPKWKVGPGLTQVRLDLLFPGQKAAGIVVQGPARPQPYEVWAWNAKGDAASELSVCLVQIGPPGPTPPIPPGPTPVPPGPTPVPPGPTPSPNPFIEPAFHAIVIYETADLLPPLQRAVLTGTDVRNYLKSKGADGYRFLDKDADVSESPKWVKDAMERRPTSYPWIMIGSGANGYEGRLPGTIEETLSLLRKVGG